MPPSLVALFRCVGGRSVSEASNYLGFLADFGGCFLNFNGVSFLF